MADINYTEIYKLQDRVMDIVFSVENEFYLTGGTCLNRFYHEKRYSDDLDFFAQNSPRYSFAVKNIKKALEESFSLTVEVETKQFVRLKVDGLLQLDFVNDISERYKSVIVTDRKYLIDNVENILSNKLTAVIGRDNPKDIFDIYLISVFYSFDWTEILSSAHRKAGFGNEDLIIRLKSFPARLLKNIQSTDPDFLNSFDTDFPVIIDEIAGEVPHTALKKVDK